MTIGRRLTEIMTARGLSNSALAASIGVRPQAVAAWRRDVQDPQLAKLAAIAKAAGVHESDLLLPCEDERRREEKPGASGTVLSEISGEMRDLLKSSGHRLWMARVTLCDDLAEIVAACRCESIRLWRSYEDGLHFPDRLVVICFCRHTGVTLDFIYRGVLAGLPEPILRKLTAAYPELIGAADKPPEERKES